MHDYDLYRVFKTLHVVSIILLGSGFVMEALCGILAARARSVAEVRVFATLLAFSENILSPAAAVAIAVFGYATASQAGYDLGITWLLLGQVLFYALSVLAIAFLRPAANELLRLSRGSADGPVTPEISAQMQKPLTKMIGPITTVMFIFIIYLMVSKPNW